MLKQKHWTLVSDTLCNVAETNHSVNTTKTLLETALPCSLGAAEGRMVINGLSAVGCSCDFSLLPLVHPHHTLWITSCFCWAVFQLNQLPGLVSHAVTQTLVAAQLRGRCSRVTDGDGRWQWRPLLQVVLGLSVAEEASQQCCFPASPCPGTVCTAVGTQWAGEGRSCAGGDGEAGQHGHSGTSSATPLTDREHFTHSVRCAGLVKQIVVYNSFCLQTAVAGLFINGFSEVLQSSQVLGARTIC